MSELYSQKDVPMKFAHVKNQYLAVFFVNLASFANGLGVGWLSPFIPLLLSTDTPIVSGILTTDQLSLAGALLSIGAVVGTAIYSIINKCFGLKISLLLMLIPYMIYCLLILFGETLECLYIGRLMTGITTGGVALLISPYIADVSSDHIRGTLGLFYTYAMNFGILCNFILGTYLPYRLVPCIMIVFPIIYFFAMLFFPETPQALLSKGDVKGAEKSLRFYKNCYKDEIRLKLELTKLEFFLANKEQYSVQCADLTNPMAIRGFLIGSVMVLLSIFSGGMLFNTYTSTFYAGSGSSIDPNVSSIITVVVQLLGTFTASYAVDKFGRRFLMVVSTLGGGICLAATGLFIYFSVEVGMDLSMITWIPIVSISGAVLFYSVGLSPLVYIIILEVVPAKIRFYTQTYFILLMSCAVFITARYVLLLAEIIGLYGVLWMFSLICLSGLLFTIFLLPETKGINLNK